MKLTENASLVFNYVKDNGGRVSIPELATALGKTEKSINGTVTALGCKGPHAKGLVDRDKVSVEGQEKPITYVVLTEAGRTFVPSEDAE